MGRAGSGAVAIALALLSSVSVRADVCTALFDQIELPAELRAFLDDPKIQGRISSYDSDREPFSSFYNEIESWLMMEKNTGKASKASAKLRVPGGDPLLRFMKRSKYDLKASFRVDQPGEITIDLALGSARTATPSAILDLQALELAVVNRLFASFSGDELRQVTLNWKLAQSAPEGFGDHMISLGFAKDSKFLSRCSRGKGIAIAYGSTLAGAAAGGGASIPADTIFYYGDDPYGKIPYWATVGGVAAGSLTTYLTCRKPSVRGGAYQLKFLRVAEKI